MTVISVFRTPEQFTQDRAYVPSYFQVLCPGEKIDGRTEVVYSGSDGGHTTELGYVYPAEDEPDVYEYHYDGCTQSVGCLQAVCRSIHRMAEYTFTRRRRK